MDETETNFQQASCALDAGVKIYEKRVDNVHQSTLKMLGGINRAGDVAEEEGVCRLRPPATHPESMRGR